jgi:hypothetical protein
MKRAVAVLGAEASAGLCALRSQVGDWPKQHNEIAKRCPSKNHYLPVSALPYELGWFRTSIHAIILPFGWLASRLRLPQQNLWAR